MQTIKESIKKHFFLISLLFIMLLYLPVNYLSFVNMDDIELVQRLHDTNSQIDFSNLFFRNATTKYYRPLLELISHIDYALWGMSITGYHFTNYFFHILNACLVYLIALYLFNSEKDSSRYAAISMLLFALNPLTCESVAWISGRSDLAGTFFSLLAVFFYFNKNSLRFVLTPISVFLGLMCKENALAVIPILVLLECFLNYKKKIKLRENLKGCFIWGILVFIPLGVYLFLRTNGWEYFTYNYIETITVITGKEQVGNKIDFLRILYICPVIAFYLKKIFIPFPLNFAISQINIFFYTLLFIVFFLINIMWLFKKKLTNIFVSIILVISFVPALPVAFGGVAWVPFAERYLYLSVSVMAVTMGGLLKKYFQKNIFKTRTLMIFSIIIISIFSISTLARIFVWKDSKSLWADTLKKNPNSNMVLFKYGQAFGGKEAQWAYKKAVSNSNAFKWKALTLMAIAEYESSVGNFDKAIANYEDALKIKGTYTNYYKAAEIITSMSTANIERKLEFTGKAIEYFQLAYSKKNKPIALYKSGVLLRRIDRIDDANKLFTTIIKKHPNTIYAINAKKIINRAKNTQ